MPTPLARHRAAEPESAGGRPPSVLTLVQQYLPTVLLVLIGALLVEVLFESWVQALFGNQTKGANGAVVGSLAEWPKQVKNGLLIALVVLTAAKITMERRWREFRTRADIALVVLTVVMILAGVFNGSGPKLIGEAIFVYLRGAIVFYAVRALHPTWPQIKRVLWVVGAVVGLNVVIAIVQMIFPAPAPGVVDHTWADLQRSTGLLDHPNHLGHILGVVLIGLFAWMTGLPKVTRWWWVAFGVAALGMAATQSRESMLAAVASGALIWLLRRRGRRAARATGEPAGPATGTPGRTVLIGGLVIVALFSLNTVLRPGNLGQLGYRIGGFFNAVQTPANQENCTGYPTIAACVAAGKVQPREVRLLFIEQGARLLVHRPVLGYGVGHFGGIVAYDNDPHWASNPRFPGGFKLYDFTGTTVDCFWLHEGVETGVLGLLAYLAWLWLLTVPLLGVTRRFAGRRVWGAGGPREQADGRAQTVALWAVGAMLFTVIVACFSPALEDPLYPPLVFAVFGIGWVLTRDVRHAEPARTRDPQTDAIGS
jgi:hypothetical protein